MTGPIRGSCLCGNVRFAIDGKVGPIGQCHCSKCRKVSGTDGNAVFYTATASFTWLSGEEGIVTFPVPGGNGWASRFCGTCGSPAPHPNREHKKVALPLHRVNSKVKLQSSQVYQALTAAQKQWVCDYQANTFLAWMGFCQ